MHLKELEANLTRDIKHLEERISDRIASMGYKTIIGLGSVMVAGITILGILMQLH